MLHVSYTLHDESFLMRVDLDASFSRTTPLENDPVSVKFITYRSLSPRLKSGYKIPRKKESVCRITRRFVIVDTYI